MVASWCNRFRRFGSTYGKESFKAKVVTPVKGFDAVWEKMLGKFVTDTGVGNVSIEINDDNATPIVVYMRLRQALAEATAKEAE